MQSVVQAGVRYSHLSSIEACSVIRRTFLVGRAPFDRIALHYTLHTSHCLHTLTRRQQKPNESLHAQFELAQRTAALEPWQRRLTRGPSWFGFVDQPDKHSDLLLLADCRSILVIFLQLFQTGLLEILQIQDRTQAMYALKLAGVYNVCRLCRYQISDYDI
jgi:hypothetical protein